MTTDAAGSPSLPGWRCRRNGWSRRETHPKRITSKHKQSLQLQIVDLQPKQKSGPRHQLAHKITSSTWPPSTVLVELRRRRGRHHVTLDVAKRFSCDASEDCRMPATRNVIVSYDARDGDARHGDVLESDGFYWTHPASGSHSRSQ